MRITRIERRDVGIGQSFINVRGTVGGIPFGLSLGIPASWDEMTGAQKVAWGKEKLRQHLETHVYAEPFRVFPDHTASEDAKDDFEQLPGWATWTAGEAAAWIEANVTDLASAKVALKAMAKAICYLRDIVIER